MNNQFRWTFLLLAAVAAWTDGRQKALAAEGMPNVVLIFADDLGYGDLGCYGATKVQTPNIDRLAKEGRRFTDAHSASAVCTPSRYALLTGEYPFRAMGGKGSWGPLPATSGLIIDTETLTIGKVFKNKGYATACLGKWHLGFKQGRNDWQVPLRPGPQDVGFDHYFGVPLVNSGSPYVYVEDETIVGYDPSDPLVYGGKPVSPTPMFPAEASKKSPNKFSGALKAHQIYDDEKTGTLLTEKAVKWITEKKDKPFFLYFPTPNIHHPFTPAPRLKGTSQCGLYGDFIHELDWMVGELLKCLEDNGLSDNTLVIFTSDNGGMLNRAGRDAMKAGHKINGDLLGFKFGVWEGGHRIPFIARWPGKIKAGTQSDQLLGQVDLLATFMALTGQDVQTMKGKDSVNMLPALLDDPDKPLRTELVLAPRQPRNLAIRKGKWMYIGARGSGGFTGSRPNQHAWGGPSAAEFAGSANSDIENGRIKKNAPPAQLYDLESDLAQTKNVYRENFQVVKRMEALLNHYRPKKTNGGTPKKRRRRKKRPNKQAAPSSEAPKKQAAAPPESRASRANVKKPNFVVIFADDLGYGDLSCYRPTGVKTPHIDTLAAEGFRSTDFFVPANVCSPSRAALLTGRYPMRCGMPVARKETPGSKYKDYGFAADEITIPELLRPAGYRSLMVGKWRLGMEVEGSHPIDAGFDEHLGIPSNYAKNRGPNYNTLYRGKKVEERNVACEVLPKRYTDEVVEFIERQKDKPFFIYVSHHIVHSPLLPSKAFVGKSRKGKYGDFIKELDHSTGRIMKVIRDAGLDDNTLVVFTSDNGPTRRGSTGGFNGGKYCTMEGGHRVPGIFRWPGKIAPKQVSDVTLTSMDLLPLFCELAGVKQPSDRKIDGKDIFPILQGKETASPHEFTSDNGPSIPGKATPLSGKKGSTREGGMREPTVIHWPGKIRAGVVNDELMTTIDLLPTLAQNSRPAAFVDNPKPLSKATGAAVADTLEKSVGSLKTIYTPAIGIGQQKGVMRRDPSDIIKVGDLYYVWYSKGKISPGYDATVWYATSPDGRKWTEKGMALAKGKAGTWEGASVFTPNILVAEGRYWLFYTGTSRKYGKRFNPDSKIGIAVSDSPDGPWERLASNPALKNSDNPKDFDSHLVDDACLIKRDGKYWFYYKGRQLGKSPGQTKLGLAIADKPQGPYIKYKENPVIPGNHEVLVWPQGKGVAALIGKVGPANITRSILYAEGGLHFSQTHHVANVPTAAGAYRPEAFTESGAGKLIKWGVHIGKQKRSLPFIQRFDLVEGN